MTETTCPRVSIVTGIHEYRTCERKWLAAARAMTIAADEFEVILVDGSRHPNYEEIFRAFSAGVPDQSNIFYHRIKRGGRAASLNFAIERARADLIIFLADDFIIGPDFVRTHLRFHEQHPEPEAVGIGSAMIPAAIGTPFSSWLERTGRFFSVPFSAEMTEVPENFFYVGNSSVKRELLTRAGSFDERFQEHAWDDFEFGQRLFGAGMRALFIPEACALHEHAIDLAERERSSESAGVAAHIHHLIHNDARQDWRSRLGRSHVNHFVRTQAARARMSLLPSRAATEHWWGRRLDAAFARGYRRAARK